MPSWKRRRNCYLPSRHACAYCQQRACLDLRSRCQDLPKCKCCVHAGTRPPWPVLLCATVLARPLRGAGCEPPWLNGVQGTFSFLGSSCKLCGEQERTDAPHRTAPSLLWPCHPSLWSLPPLLHRVSLGQLSAPGAQCGELGPTTLQQSQSDAKVPRRLPCAVRVHPAGANCRDSKKRAAWKTACHFPLAFTCETP